VFAAAITPRQTSGGRKSILARPARWAEFLEAHGVDGNHGLVGSNG